MKVCIFGLGRIGLPIALVCADSDYKVVGIDINEKMVNCLKKAKAPFEEPGMEELLKKNLNKNFHPKNPNVDNVTQDLEQADYIILAVGTRFAKYPDNQSFPCFIQLLVKLYRLV